jgi:hypothetical protein
MNFIGLRIRHAHSLQKNAKELERMKVLNCSSEGLNCVLRLCAIERNVVNFCLLTFICVRATLSYDVAHRAVRS